MQRTEMGWSPGYYKFAQRAVRLYFYLTPVFFALDFFQAINLRNPALDATGIWKWIHYAVISFVAVGLWKNWRSIKWIAFFECILDLILVFIAFYMRLLPVLDGEGNVLVGIPALAVFNFLMIASLSILSFELTNERTLIQPS